MTAAKRRPAKRPAPRTVDVTLAGDFAGWSCVARADFPARYLTALESQEASAFLDVMDRIVISHNFPNEDDELAERMGDVDPFGGLVAAASEILDRIRTLPPR